MIFFIFFILHIQCLIVKRNDVVAQVLKKHFYQEIRQDYQDFKKIPCQTRLLECIQRLEFLIQKYHSNAWQWKFQDLMTKQPLRSERESLLDAAVHMRHLYHTMEEKLQSESNTLIPKILQENDQFAVSNAPILFKWARSLENHENQFLILNTLPEQELVGHMEDVFKMMQQMKDEDSHELLEKFSSTTLSNYPKSVFKIAKQFEFDGYRLIVIDKLTNQVLLQHPQELIELTHLITDNWALLEFISHLPHAFIQENSKLILGKIATITLDEYKARALSSLPARILMTDGLEYMQISHSILNPLLRFEVISQLPREFLLNHQRILIQMIQQPVDLILLYFLTEKTLLQHSKQLLNVIKNLEPHNQFNVLYYLPKRIWIEHEEFIFHLAMNMESTDQIKLLKHYQSISPIYMEKHQEVIFEMAQKETGNEKNQWRLFKLLPSSAFRNHFTEYVEWIKNLKDESHRYEFLKLLPDDLLQKNPQELIALAHIAREDGGKRSLLELLSRESLEKYKSQVIQVVKGIENKNLALDLLKSFSWLNEFKAMLH